MKSSLLRFALFWPFIAGFAACEAFAGLVDPGGLWQLNGSLGGNPGGSLQASTLTAGTDYSYAIDSQGYHFLQTQTWAPAKRLTVPNSTGNNGGGSPTRTNRWTILMDVKFDALQPFAAVLQTDPANLTDAPFYIASANNSTGTLHLSGVGTLSAAGAIPLNAWCRLAITCGNDGAGGPVTLKCYINGDPSGVPRTAGFNGPAALASSFHLFTDDNSEVKPAKLSSFALWPETLGEADIRLFGGPQSSGIQPYVSWINFAGIPAGPGFADGTGTKAHFNSPYGVALDQNGTIFVTDAGNHAIRKITAGGVVTTLAGSPGNAGSVDGQGNQARFSEPTGIAIDSAGTLYVSDSANHAIRKITASGLVTTLAGRLGTPGNANGDVRTALFREPKGVALDGSGHLLVADFGNSAIRKVVLATGVVSTLTAGASLYSEPHGVAVDGNGTLYVANTDDGKIIKINPAGVVSILAQSPALEARSYGIAVDGGGNVFVTDFNGRGITKVTPSGASSVVAGSSTEGGDVDGEGTSARFLGPAGLAFDGGGNLIIADALNHKIRRMTPLRTVTTVAGSPDNAGLADGVGSGSRFQDPLGMATDSGGNVYVADAGNHTIRKITAGGLVSTLAGAAGLKGSADGPGSSARFNFPSGIAVDAFRNVYVADSYNHTIRKIDPSGNVSTLAGMARSWGNANGQGSAARFDFPTGITVDATGTVYVADFDGRRVRKITPAGLVSFFAGFPGDASHTTEPTRFTSASLAADNAGNVFFITVNKHHISKINAAGTIDLYAGSETSSGYVDGPRLTARFDSPRGVAVDEAGNVYVSEAINHTVRKIATDGQTSTLGGSPTFPGTRGGPGRTAQFNGPSGLAVDAHGVIYLADSRNQRLCRGSPGTGNESLTGWRLRHFGISTDSGNAANTFDFDRDGSANLLEYAMGTDPTARTSAPSLPAGIVADGNFQVAFIPPAGVNAVNYLAEGSSTLQSGRWSDLVRQFRNFTYNFGTPLGSPSTRGFIRLKITEIPVTDADYQLVTP